MSDPNDLSNFTPAGWHSVTPRIVADRAEELVAFLKHVFHATGEYRTDRPTIVSIGDSMIMISDAGGIRAGRDEVLEAAIARS